MVLDSKYAEHYQKLLDRISDLAWIADESGRLHLVNNTWQKQRRSQPQLSFFWDEILPEQRESVEQQWHDFKFTPDVWRKKLALIKDRNDYDLFEVNIEQLTSDNELPLWIGTASEVSTVTQLSISTSQGDELADYKQKEIKLQRNVEFVRRIIDSSKDCIKVLDLEGKLLYMNDGGQDIMEIDDFTTVQNAVWLNFWQGCNRDAAEQALEKRQNR